MTVNEMIEKFKIGLAAKDGVEGIMVCKKATPAQLAELRNAKPEIMAELKRRETEIKEKREAEAAIKRAETLKEIEEIKSGNKKIKLSYHDGEYLSGHSTYGVASGLLNELGLAHDVSGWGTFVKSEVVEALGTEFTYQQAAEFAAPAIKAKEEKKAIAKAERNTIFEKAKETGEKQILHRWSEPCNDPSEECNTDILIQYAMPDGTTKTTRNHTW